MHIDHLEYTEPVSICEIKVGTFYYLDTTEEQVTAEFYVRTCEENNQSKRIDDYNEQYTDEYTHLIVNGCTEIKFIEVTPNPIF